MHSLFRTKHAVIELRSLKAENIQKKHSKNVTFCLLCDILYTVEGVGD